ncbi:restriction endonuclease subunit S [Cronobacter dublinensis]
MSAGTLPEGWAEVPVSSVASLIRGVTYKKEQAINYRKDDYLPLIRANNIQNGKFDTTDLVFVPKNLVKESQKISPEDIVIAMSSGSKSVVGKSAHQHLPFECSFGAFCGVLRPEKLIFPSFIAHFTKSSFYRNKISSLSAGANINNIKPASFDLIKIPIPSLAEQEIIAEKLDTLLAQVDSTKARLEQIPQILKRFRQALMAAAVSGHLTEAWRNKHCNIDINNISVSKYKPNNGLFEQAKSSVPEIPSSWQIIPSAHLIEYITSGSRGWADYYSTEGALFLRMSNVRYNTTKLDLDDLQFVNLPGSVEGKRSHVKVDDLIISLTADVGRVAKIDKDLGEAYINQHLALVRPTKNIDSEYFALCIASQNIGAKQIQFFKKGATKAGLGLDDIRSLAIPFPPLSEQQEIVRRVEQLFIYTDTIEKQVNNALTRVNNLTQSILAKAFRGELSSQWRAENPELITGENSAAALLKKIKDEREAIKRLPKPKRSAIKKKTGKRMSKQIIKVVEALTQAGEPLSGQQLLDAAGYPGDSNTDDLEKFFLDIRQALIVEKSIVKLERSEDGQDWFSLAEVGSNE